MQTVLSNEDFVGTERPHLTLPLTLCFAVLLALTNAFIVFMQGETAWFVIWTYLKTSWIAFSVGIMLQIWFSDET